MANIELDGVNKTIKVDSGDLTLDVPGDIILDGDGADVHFRDDGTGYLQIGNSSNDVLLTSLQSDKDMIFKGVDGGSLITALTLDMSAAGNATFNADVTVGGTLNASSTQIITSNTPIISFIESDQSNKQYQIGSFGAAFAIYDQSNTQFRYIIDTNGNHVFNEGSADCDFRVESNGKTHALFVDGGNDKIGIINSTPNSFETGYNDLVVGDTDTHHGLTIVGGTSHQSSIAFADGTSGNAAYRGSIYYNHASDAMVLSTSATQVASFHTDGIVFNENSNDQNFRVEGADDINNFFVDAGNNRIGIGQGSPNAKLDVDSSSTSQIAGMFTASSASFGGDGITRIVCTRANTTAYEFMRVISGGTADVEYILRGDGNAFADQSWNASGADYAEYFEWKDGNASDEDRRGYPVILDGNKIVQATDSDDASKIIGIISGNPAMVGDGAYTKWNDKYQKDDFGTYLRDENGYRILNTNYDETKDYVPRENRKEWDTVGLMGKLRLRKGQPTGTNWIKMRDISDTVEEWLVR